MIFWLDITLNLVSQPSKGYSDFAKGEQGMVTTAGGQAQTDFAADSDASANALIILMSTIGAGNSAMPMNSLRSRLSRARVGHWPPAAADGSHSRRETLNAGLFRGLRNRKSAGGRLYHSRACHWRAAHAELRFPDKTWIPSGA